MVHAALRPVLGLLTAGLAIAQLSVSSVASDFYSGKSINIVVGSAVGGTYDFYARTIQRHLGKHIAGRPNIVVQNMPGAGGMVAANHVANRSPRDGTVILLVNRGAVLSAILGSKEAQFKPAEFNWLGTTASFAENAHLFIINSSLPHQTIEDLRNPDLPKVNVGVSGSHHTELMAATFGFNLNLVRGYDRAQLDLAFERGEVDGTPMAYTSLLSRQPHWLEKRVVRPMIQFARTERHPDFPEVPTAREVAPTPEALAMLELAEAAFLMAYPFALPPSVPEERVAILREASANMLLGDSAYREDILSQNIEHSPKTGKDVQDLIERVSRTPQDLMDRYKEIIAAAGMGE